MNILLVLILSFFVATPSPSLAKTSAPIPASTVLSVPFYSQFTDISSAKWQKVGCGITSLAMVIDYYKPAIPVNTLLAEGLALGAYSNAGWTYSGLITTSKKYGMQGTAYDLGSSDMNKAFSQFSTTLKAGPVIASVHYKFDPKSTIPHLVVINSIKDGVVYYNDPAAKSGGLTISVADFQMAWKKRYIVIRPSPSDKVAYTY